MISKNQDDSGGLSSDIGGQAPETGDGDPYKQGVSEESLSHSHTAEQAGFSGSNSAHNAGEARWALSQRSSEKESIADSFGEGGRDRTSDKSP